MEQFPDGAHVRLRSREHGGYLHADEDGRGVSLSFSLRSMSMVWKVHRTLHEGSTWFLLQSTAEGRYLAASSDPAPPGHRVLLGDFDGSILWKAVELGNAGYVLLRHVSNRLLRVIARQLNGVCIDVAQQQSTMMHWKVETIPKSPTAVPATAIEQFPDGAYVRLRSRVNGRYLHADEDGVRVRFLPHRGSLNVVWRVHRVLHHGTSRILLHSAAYGRYLRVSRDYSRRAAAPTLVQSVYYNNLQQNDLRWVLEMIHEETSSFWLVNPERNFTIPGDGTPLVAESIPSRSGLAPDLPGASHEVGFYRRIVVYIQGDEFGNIDFTAARAIIFQGRSVSRLRAQLADSLDERRPETIAICLWTGFHGRLIPLISDLPANNHTIEVILFESWTGAALGLQYPIMDEE